METSSNKGSSSQARTMYWRFAASHSTSCVRQLLLTLILLLTKVALQGVGGCSYSKVDSAHTMCIFKPQMCSGKRLIKSGGISCLDKEVILMTHNRLRQNLALGTVMGQPAALNMETMVWNDELASIAQRWADQCRPGHDRSRNLARFTVGQNVAAVWTYDHDEGPEADFKTQIEAWFNEVMKQGFSKSTIEPFRYSKIAGHYTQLAWADTYMVGCGFSYYYDKSTGYTKLYVCNYAPGGNVVGGSMYKVGFPGQPYCVQHGLEPDMNMRGLCVREDVNYMTECAKMEVFSSGPNIEVQSTPPQHPPLMMMLMNRMTPPPPPQLTKRPPPKSHHSRFHSSSISHHSHSHFNLQNSFHHGPPQPPSFKKGIPSPFKTFSDIFSPWKHFSKHSS